MSWHDQWAEGGFLMQIICLTIGPAFMMADIYFCLSRIVLIYGPENLRITPQISSPATSSPSSSKPPVVAWSNERKSTTTGNNIMIAGLTFQVVITLGFIAATTDFFLRTKRFPAQQSQTHYLIQLRQSTLFKWSLAALALATLLILWRSVFRVAELSGG
ncbi:uncharacterized protein BCR38DRAFT_526213 [Pseudomassariella vexata]|uniref:Uncharacterized protein n=1 Tax=Pseudomassariella vexata TaxID=1141098 RepID=A0A1Y2DN70_9PEZI|nr:uncharacterized protein BCR38DRAFT_526213 [Pseudomassariella vexata]ORY60619.1 hypothetical protein BCR38DRAFT_526213 [Pseudomassariella vexata]